MIAVTGVFQSRPDAERAMNSIRQTGIPDDKITLLTPGQADQVKEEVKAVPTDASEQPGMGKTVGALLGGGVGFTGGSILVALVPGLGPITALGMLGAGVLGVAGAAIGGSTGGEVEKSSYEGLPEDEIFVYEDALRRGRTVVIALADDESSAGVVRDMLKREGAESVDAAREQWWTGLRNSEEAHYTGGGKNFNQDEKFYRLGFEAAMHARTRCMEFDQVSAEMSAALENVKRKNPGADVEDAFTRGYRRGREHYQQLCNDSQKAA